MKLLKSLLCSVLLLPLSFLSAEETTLFNVVALQTSVENEINNNQMLVTLSVEYEDPLAVNVSNKINKDMQWALEIVKKHKDIQSQNQGYSIYPVYRNKQIANTSGYEQEQSGWRGSQSLQLKSENMAALTKLTGELQSRLQVKDMAFAPTSAVRKAEEDRLIDDALNTFKQRAEIVRKNMKAAQYTLVDISISTNNDSGPVYPVHKMRMGAYAADDSQAPAASAGTSKVVVTVSGRVQLK